MLILYAVRSARIFMYCAMDGMFVVAPTLAGQAKDYVRLRGRSGDILSPIHTADADATQLSS